MYNKTYLKNRQTKSCYKPGLERIFQAIVSSCRRWRDFQCERIAGGTWKGGERVSVFEGSRFPKCSVLEGGGRRGSVSDKSAELEPQGNDTGFLVWHLRWAHQFRGRNRRRGTDVRCWENTRPSAYDGRQVILEAGNDFMTSTWALGTNKYLVASVFFMNMFFLAGRWSRTVDVMAGQEWLIWNCYLLKHNWRIYKYILPSLSSLRMLSPQLTLWSLNYQFILM